MKEVLKCFLATAIAVSFLSASVYAHTGDILSGSYTTDIQKNLKLRITTSAQIGLMDKTVYETALNWNGISSKVHVSVIMETYGMPTIAGTINVYGNASGELEFDTLGKTMYFNSKNKAVPYSSKDIAYAVIYMNTTTTAFNNYGNTSYTQSLMGKTFTHEVGHVLLLDHPKENSSYSDHCYDGKPYAVMNQGLPVPSIYPETAPIPVAHDKYCLKTKWGY